MRNEMESASGGSESESKIIQPLPESERERLLEQIENPPESDDSEAVAEFRQNVTLALGLGLITREYAKELLFPPKSAPEHGKEN